MKRPRATIADTSYHHQLQILRKYGPETGRIVLQERLHLFRLENRQGFQLLKIRPSFLAGAADQYDRRTVPLFGTGRREFIGSGRPLPCGVCRIVRWTRERERIRRFGRLRRGRRYSFATERMLRLNRP